MEKVEGVKKLSSDTRVNSKKNSNTLNSNVLKQMFTLNHTFTNNY